MEKRSVQTMRRHELVREAERLGVKNTERYIVRELRSVVTSRLRTEREG